MEWSETCLAVALPTIEATADRIETLRRKFNEEAARSGPLAVRAVQVAVDAAFVRRHIEAAGRGARHGRRAGRRGRWSGAGGSRVEVCQAWQGGFAKTRRRGAV